MKRVLVLLIAILIVAGLSGSSVVCARGTGKCQEARKETWVLHEGDRLDLQEWCCRDRGPRCDEAPEPPIGFLIPMRPGQTLKLRARRWGQGVRVQCGKPCYNWGNECHWVGGDIPKGSIFRVECHEGAMIGPFPWPEGAIRLFESH